MSPHTVFKMYTATRTSRFQKQKGNDSYCYIALWMPQMLSGIHVFY